MGREIPMRNSECPGERHRGSSDCPFKEQIVIAARQPGDRGIQNGSHHPVSGEAP